MDEKIKNYFEMKRKVKDIARQLKLKTAELESLLYMGENGFDVPLERHPSLKGLTTQYDENRGAMVVPGEIGLDSVGQTIPNLVRKGYIKKLAYSENLKKGFLELTFEGIELYKKAKSKF